MIEHGNDILEQETSISNKKDIHINYKAEYISKKNVAAQEQEQLDNENEMLSFMWFEDYFNNREYYAKQGDWFLKIIQGLLGYTITKNIPWEDLVALSKLMDQVFQEQTSLKIRPNDKISLHDWKLSIHRNWKNIFQRYLPIMPQSMQMVSEKELSQILNTTSNKNPYIKNYNIAQESTFINKINIIWQDGKILPWRKLTKYEIISDWIDDVLAWLWAASALIIITWAGPILLSATWISIGVVWTALMVASIAKCLTDAAYDYSKSWSVTWGSWARLWINIWASILDRYTLRSGSKIIAWLWTIMDEWSDILGQQLKQSIDN